MNRAALIKPIGVGVGVVMVSRADAMTAVVIDGRRLSLGEMLASKDVLHVGAEQWHDPSQVGDDEQPQKPGSKAPQLVE